MARGSKYDQYLDGQLWRLDPGLDFDAGKLEQARSEILKRARLKGLRVSTRNRFGGSLFVRAEGQR